MYHSKPIHFKTAIPALVIALALWIVLTFFQGHFLYKNGDMSLFLFDWDFFKEAFSIPGGFLGWVGSFFSQFLLIPWIGALLWTLLLLLAWWKTVQIFKIPDKLSALAALPVGLLIIANMSLGYSIYYLQCHDYFFAPVIGYLLMIGIMDATWRLKGTAAKIAFIFASAFGGYCLAGVFALAGVIAAGIGTAAAPDSKDFKGHIWERYAVSAAAAVFCAAAPFVLYRLFTSFSIADSLLMGLPNFTILEWAQSVRLPYWLLFGLTAAMAIARPYFANAESDGRKMALFNPAITLAAIIATSVFWFKDDNFKAEIKMSLAAERNDWQKVIDIFETATAYNPDKEEKKYKDMAHELANANDEETYSQIIRIYNGKISRPTRLMVILRDLALLKQGKALDKAFAMQDGGKKQESKFPIVNSIEAGQLVFFNYGAVNIGYHWCLENQVLLGWSYSSLRAMTSYAVIMNESEFAAKFLDKLDKTLFFRKWSREQRVLANDVQAMSSAQPYKDILPYMCFENRMAEYDDGDCEIFLVNHFFKNRSNWSTPEFDRAALLWAMRYKDSVMFWKALAQYFTTNNPEHLPKHVQEAALLFCSIENEDLGITFDKEVLDGFTHFQEYVQKYGVNSNTIYRLWRNFGDTYYYYYFVTNVYSFKFN